ncbi:hypothetical protein DNTS_033344 [Danionella cerebrum]|uniref:DUF4745 domain-containing protein n=1 Tax=Danionella cerebrum TaxID=2873325 RepID=A0A553QKB8_9TELE|nr:hypothetical protein DNTS_033344 [Danionella translucida]
MYCCSAQESKMDYKLRFLLGGSKHKVQQHQQFQLPELSRTLSAPLASSCSAPSPMPTIGPCQAPPPGSHTSAIADIQQGISKYLEALNAFCRASAFLTELFGSVFRDSCYSKAAMQLKDVQEHVMETTSRLTTAIKPEIGKMLMELSAGAANFKDQNDFSLQDVEVHFQFLSQALQKVQPVAQSCLAEALAQVQERRANTHNSTSSPGGGPGPRSELEEALRSWRGAAELTACLRERGRDGCLAGLQVQQLFCSQNTNIPEQQLKDLNRALRTKEQAYKAALESLGHSEYSLKAGFHLNPKSVEAALKAEAQQAGRFHSPSQPIQCELPTIPVQIGSHLLRGVSFNESTSDNLKLKTRAVLQLIKDAVDQNGVCVRDDSPVTEVLSQVCPSSWRGACKTAVQLLFGQAGLVVVDTAQIENKEAYAPQISLEGSKVVIQVPSTWCLKEDPATMSLLQRSLDPEKTLGLVDVLYTAVFDLQRWKERKEQSLPTIQIQLQRDSGEFVSPPGNTISKSSSGGLPKTISKLTSRFTRKASSSSSPGGGSFSIPNTPSRNNEAIKSARSHGLLQTSSVPTNPDAPDDQAMNLPTDQEMQDVIDFLSGFNMGKSQQASPLVKRRNSVASTNAAELKPPPSLCQTLTQTQPLNSSTQKLQHNSQTLPFYQHLLQPIGQPQPPQQQGAPVSPQIPSQQPQMSSKWPQAPLGGLSPLWPPTAGLSELSLSSELYSLGLVSNYMDSVMSEMMMGNKAPQAQRNNTWPNREQGEQSGFGLLGDSIPFDPAVGSDPEFARYVAGVNQAMQQKRQAQQVLRRNNWTNPDEQHRGWPHSDYFAEGEAVNSGWAANQGDSASSSDETSSANGDSLFSMFSGPDLVAAVKQRRKHSCGEQEVCTLPSPPLHHSSDDSNQDSKTKTWPPKAPWQHSSHTNTMPNPGSSLYHMAIPSSQWGDSMQMLQSPVWSTANECSPSAGITSGFPFSQQQQQQQQKILSKGFKSFPLKPEQNRPSYLHQY